MTDLAGRPIATIESLVTRPLTAEPAAEVGRRGLFRPEWTRVEFPRAAEGGAWALLGDDALGLDDALPAAGDPATPAVVVLPVASPAGGVDVPRAVQELTARVLTSLQRWLDEESQADARLVVVTRHATAPAPDLPSAAVWGLVRSAQSENPGRIVLVDLDTAPASARALAAAVATGEPQLSIRDGAAYVPRLDQAAGLATGRSIDPAGTVLITGGTGALGAVLARHLAAHEVRHLLPVSRRGPQAPGAERLRAELAELGACPRVVSCDVTDRAALEAVISGCEPALTAVVHAAGGLDDGVLGSLTPQRLATVLAPKADASWFLHELAKDLDLSAFVVAPAARRGPAPARRDSAHIARGGPGRRDRRVLPRGRCCVPHNRHVPR